MEAVSFTLQTTVVWLFSTIATDRKSSKRGTERIWVGATVMEGWKVPRRPHSYQGTERQRLCPFWIYRLLNLDWLKNLWKLVIWIAVETGKYTNRGKIKKLLLSIHLCMQRFACSKLEVQRSNLDTLITYFFSFGGFQFCCGGGSPFLNSFLFFPDFIHPPDSVVAPVTNGWWFTILQKHTAYTR